MRRHNCIEIIGSECVIDSGPRCVGSVCSCGDVNGIIGITHGLFRCFEDLLAIVNQLPGTMRYIEIDQITQCSHVSAYQGGEIVRDLRLEFVEQRRELVIGVREYVTGIGVYNRCTEAFHYVQRALRKCDGVLVALNATAIVPVIEKPHVPTDPRALECTAL